MKVFKNNAVYVQRDDLGFLHSSDLTIPASIFLKAYGEGVTIIDEGNRWDFIRFDEPSEVDFFRGLDWIIDWESVKDLSEEKVGELGQSVLEERNSLAQRFNGMNPEEQTENSDIPFKCTCLDHKIQSLVAVYNFKQGYLKMAFPGELESPTESAPTESVVIGPVIPRGKAPKPRWPFRRRKNPNEQ